MIFCYVRYSCSCTLSTRILAHCWTLVLRGKVCHFRVKMLSLPSKPMFTEAKLTMTKIELTTANIELKRKNFINLSKIFELHLLDDFSRLFDVIQKYQASFSTRSLFTSTFCDFGNCILNFLSDVLLSIIFIRSKSSRLSKLKPSMASNAMPKVEPNAWMILNKSRHTPAAFCNRRHGSMCRKTTNGLITVRWSWHSYWRRGRWRH